MTQQPHYGYPPQPGPYGTPPPQPPKKGIGVGGGIALGCGGLLLVGVLLFTIAAFASIGDSSSTASRPTPAATTKAPAAAPPKATPAKEQPAAEPALKIEAKKTPFTRGILASEGPHTSVRVTIINNTDETISVNPLYFTITATDGMKYTHELAADEQQLDAVKLAPGEKTTGVVTGKGAFTPDYVTFTDGLFGDPIRTKVS